MRRMYFFIPLLVSFLLIGCITTERVKKPRVDQELSGNIGYVKGQPSEEELTRPTVKEREYLSVEVEIPPFPEFREHYWKDDKIWGNEGYVVGNSSTRR